MTKLGRAMYFSWPDVVDNSTLEKKKMASELDLYFFAKSSGCRPGEGEEDEPVLALLVDSTGQLVLGGEKMWFLLSGMALPETGRKETTLAGWENAATWQRPKWPDRDHVSREHFGRHGTLRRYGPTVVSGIGAGIHKALLPGAPKGRTCLVSSSLCISLVRAALPQSYGSETRR